ncbi:hypothetical protein [Fodinicola acaciae]|uniref:hypothetical protein n=1 Tax=Fodinicola acaciae TaxID=2681555 RepID=UPI0013D48A9F|nr:hypothetical protein [Fodinicola acaciae]
MGNFVNLNEVGVLSQSGQGYDGTATDQHGESRNFVGKMDASQAGLKGSAGTTFTGIANLSGGNLTQLANLIAEQARRAVMGEKTVVGADDDAHSAQQPALGAADSYTSSLSRGINA